MKFIFASLIISMFALNVLGQNNTPVDSVDICGSKFPLSPGLKLTSPNQLTAPGYSVSWIYTKNQRELDKIEDRIITSVSRQFKNFSQQTLYGLFLYQPCKAYGLTYTDEQGNKAGQLLVFSTIKNQPVYLQIQIADPVFENEKLPLFINRIIVLDR